MDKKTIIILGIHSKILIMTTPEVNFVYNHFCKKCKHDGGLSRAFVNCRAQKKLVFLDFTVCQDFEYPNTMAQEYKQVRKNMLKIKKINVK